MEIRDTADWKSALQPSGFWSARAACLALALTGWLLAGTASAQTSALFQNYGVLQFPPAPPIAAWTVENLGTISAVNGTGTSTLFDTQNTTNFINRGSMFGFPGYLFDYVQWDSGLRLPAAAFANQGSIFATDNILVQATNIANLPGGKLSADRSGRVRLETTFQPLDGPVTLIPGGTINLLSSRIRAGDSSEVGNAGEGAINLNGGTYAVPDNVVDYYWGGSSGSTLAISSLRSGGFSRPGGHGVTNRGSLRFTEFLNVNPPVDTNFPTIPGYSFYIYTNFVFTGPATDRIIRGVAQMVFVQTNLPNSPEVRVHFTDQVNRDNYQLREVALDFGINDFDPVTGQSFTRYIRLRDRLATNASASGITAPNFLLSAPRSPRADTAQTFRSDNYALVRSDSPLGTGTPPSDFDPNYIWSFPTLLATNIGARFQTNIVPHTYAAYQFGVRSRDVGGGGTGSDLLSGNAVLDQLNDPTNSPGRVELVADQLNLNFATIRADNLLSIRASNVTSLAGLRVDAQNVDLNLLANTGTVVLSNTFPNEVSRLNGQVSVWSGVWQVNQFITNSVQFGITNIPGVMGVSGTNTIEWTYHMMVVDLDNSVFDDFGTRGGGFFQSSFLQLQTNQPVVFPNFRINAANVQLHDTNTITRSFFLGGTNWLIGSNGVINLSGANTAFTVANAPRLNNFTNLGLLSIPLEGNFGADRRDTNFNPVPYANIINRGSIFSGSLQFAATNFENSSNIFAFSGAVGVTAATNRLSGGAVTAAGRIDLSGNELFIAANTEFIPVFNAFGKLNISVTNRVSDSNLTNVWNLNDGVALNTRPAKGDLLATRIVSSAGTNQNVIHFWAGEDRGDSASGFANNAAVGELVLDGQPGSLFVFFPAPGQTNALYVDTLTLTNNSTNFTTALQVDPNLTIYFSKANVPGDKLTNAFGGRFVWVSPATRAGPLVAVKTSMSRTMTLTTQEYQALLAGNPDVDGDGILNELDETPFSGFTISRVVVFEVPAGGGQPPLQLAQIFWQGVAGGSYTVEYREGLGATAWSLLGVYPGSTGEMNALQLIPPGGQRFYRVRYGH